MKVKNKYILLKSLIAFFSLLNIFLVSAIYVLFDVDFLWGDMFEKGITEFSQWLTLILYRLLIYVPIPLLFAIIKYDKRTKYLTRVVIWYNWMFLVYLILYGLYDILAIDLLSNVKIFDSLSSFILLLGYIITYISKKPVSFDDTQNIIK